MPSPSTTNSAAAMAERRNHEMFAERHADRIFQVKKKYQHTNLITQKTRA